MSIFAGILFVISIVGLVRIHKEKGVIPKRKFRKGMCILILVMSCIIGGLSSMPSDETTSTTAKQSGPSIINQAKTQVAKDDAKKIDAVQVKNTIPDTQTGIGKILEMKTDTQTDTSGTIKVVYANNQYVINYSYAPLGGADKLNQELGIMLGDKIHKIYTSYSNVDKLEFIISVPLSDKYGNTTWTAYRSFEFSRALNNKINWTSDAFDKGTLIDLAENVQDIK